MPIKYVGRTTDFSGKTLWEILGNLKNFGVGRLVKRNMLERYKEPSFFRILKVDTLDNENGNDRKVRAYVEKVFRGKRYPEVMDLERISYKTDFRLVPKSEEKLLWDKVAVTEHNIKILPASIPFPPLLKLILEEEMSDLGKSSEEIMLKLVIKEGPDNCYRIAEDGEIPTVEMNQTKHPELYDDK